MVQNIAIVGLNREQAYEVAKILSSELEMYFFDTIELFEFDNIPRSLPIMLQEFGEKYFRKKEKGIIGYASDFANTVIHIDSGMSENVQNFKTVKRTSLLVYLHNPPSKLKDKLEKKHYATIAEKKFYNISSSKIAKRIERLKKYADIVVPAGSGSCLKLSSDIIRRVKELYNVG